MDGFLRGSGAGILYAEDFGEPQASSPLAAMRPMPAPPPAPHAAPPAPALCQADIDAACVRAVQAAERAWTEGAAERRTIALETIGALLSEAAGAAAQQTEALAEGVARTVLGLVSAVLPDLCRSHGDAEVRALLLRLLPVVGQAGGVIVRVHAGMIETLASDLAGLDDTLLETIQLRAANLPPGDVRLSWEAGGLVRDTACIRDAVQDCLLQLGLLDPIPEPRSLAHVQ